jgi:arylformamidase
VGHSCRQARGGCDEGRASLQQRKCVDMSLETSYGRMYDVTLTLNGDLPIFPGEPGVALEPVHRIANGDPANVSKVSMGTHTGTHLDAPLHFFDGASTVADLPLDTLIGPALVVGFQLANTIRASHLARIDLPAGTQRVLFKTRNSALLRQSQFSRDFVSIDPSAAHWLLEHGVRLVGVDYLSAEQFGRTPAETHLTLLGAGVVIVEGLDLLDVPAGQYDLICLPLKLPADGCPVRALLIEQPAEVQRPS